jgi:hypothetical protein
VPDTAAIAVVLGAAALAVWLWRYRPVFGQAAV